MNLSVDFTRRLSSFELSLSFCVDSGIHVLFGHSGVGKTQTLECIAGLARPDTGWIRLGERTLFQSLKGRNETDLRPRHRRIGYVVQDGALFPHRTLLENVRYPLRKQGVRDSKRALTLLEEVGLKHLAGKYPHEVSGGQKRRASLARALASDPPLLLLDEPFVHLDRVVKAKLMADLDQVVRSRGIIVVLVTHDFQVVARLADTILVMDAGRIIQSGSREEILFRPSSGGIARLFGDVNVLDGTVIGERGGVWRVQTRDAEWNVPFLGGLEPGQRVEVIIRTGAVKVIKPDLEIPQSLALNIQPARIIDVDRHPDFSWVHFALEEESGEAIQITGQIPTLTLARLGLDRGGECRIAVAIDGISLFPAKV